MLSFKKNFKWSFYCPRGFPLQQVNTALLLVFLGGGVQCNLTLKIPCTKGCVGPTHAPSPGWAFQGHGGVWVAPTCLQGNGFIPFKCFVYPLLLLSCVFMMCMCPGVHAVACVQSLKGNSQDLVLSLSHVCSGIGLRTSGWRSRFF